MERLSWPPPSKPFSVPLALSLGFQPATGLPKAPVKGQALIPTTQSGGAGQKHQSLLRNELAVAQRGSPEGRNAQHVPQVAHLSQPFCPVSRTNPPPTEPLHGWSRLSWRDWFAAQSLFLARPIFLVTVGQTRLLAVVHRHKFFMYLFK